MASDLDALIDRWVDEQIAMLPPMTPEDISGAVRILASVHLPARDNAA